MQQLANIQSTIEEYRKTVMSKNMKKDIIKKLKKSEEEIEKGEVVEAEISFNELRQKYGY